MVKLSVGIAAGEGPSNRVPVPKRQRTDSFSGAEYYDYVEEEEESRRAEASGGEEELEVVSSEEELDVESEEEEEEEESGSEQGATSSQTTRDGSISITLTDPEVLDCPTCYEPLTIPIFQCINGHIICFRCLIKIGRKKCPSCADRMSHIRCKAMEKVLESFKVSCQNTKYGCREAFSYKEKQEHDKKCPFVACSCPLAADCNFQGSSKQLSGHLSNEHSNKVETFGNVVTLSRIGPPMEDGFFYELIAKAQSQGGIVRLKSHTKSTPKWDDNPPSYGFLLIPSQFSCTSRKLMMKLRIWRRLRLPYPRSPL
ncbi:hypothetical protein DITRI_Ditri11bG0017000 [Diplodiscus trichospermus]